MTITIAELFGYDPGDESEEAQDVRMRLWCPFIDSRCTKQFRDGTPSGACSIRPFRGDPVIICPNRLYDDTYTILKRIASASFGPGTRLISAHDARGAAARENDVVVFGKRWGGELRLPQRGGQGAYFVDWVLARLNAAGELVDFIAVEVQSIDTTGSYRAERDAFMEGELGLPSKAGLNWENVNKRILPQLIYKGHVLRREPLCRHGLFFVCPRQVYERICQRLGGELMEYQPQPGSLTFQWYELTPAVGPGARRGLVLGGVFTTTIDQVANAFTAPANLPPARVYEAAIRNEIG